MFFDFNILVIEINKFMIVALLLYLIGLIGLFFARQNLLVMLMCIELMLLGINITLLVASVYTEDIAGELLGIFILTLAAAEASIGLAMLIVFYRLKGVISASFINSLKG